MAVHRTWPSLRAPTISTVSEVPVVGRDCGMVLGLQRGLRSLYRLCPMVGLASVSQGPDPGQEADELASDSAVELSDRLMEHSAGWIRIQWQENGARFLGSWAWSRPWGI